MEASAGTKTTSRGYSSSTVATNNKKGPAPLASFDEISVLSLDVSSPSDKGITHEDKSNFLKNFQ